MIIRILWFDLENPPEETHMFKSEVGPEQGHKCDKVWEHSKPSILKVKTLR